MSIKVHTKNGVCKARIEGEISVYTASEYREVLLKKYKAGRTMELDLSQVSEIDTCGLQLLVALQKHLHGADGELRLCDPDESVRQVLELTQLSDSFGTGLEQAAI